MFFIKFLEVDPLFGGAFYRAPLARSPINAFSKGA